VFSPYLFRRSTNQYPTQLNTTPVSVTAQLWSGTGGHVFVTGLARGIERVSANTRVRGSHALSRSPYTSGPSLKQHVILRWSTEDIMLLTVAEGTL
jgi:hypothetical protein